MAWRLRGQLVETCNCKQGLSLRGGGFVAALGLEEAELAPGMGTAWTDPEFRRIESKSGARGDFAWGA